MPTEPFLRAAAAQAVIPAEPGLDLAGFVARDNPARGKRDDIYARALALEANGHLMLLLTADVLGFEAGFITELRAVIAARLRDRAASLSITVAASHTHSAPASMALRGCGAVSAPWLHQAGAALAEVAVQAAERLQPARLGFACGDVPGVSGNRRSPGFPEEAGRPLDTELGLLRIETTDGKPLACVVNFACHPVILGADNVEISADYPGLVTRRLQEHLGAITLFTNGATGDVNPLARGSWSDVERVAAALVAEASRVWSSTETVDTAALSARAETLRLPLLPLPPRAHLEAALARHADEVRQAKESSARRTAEAFQAWAEEALTRGPQALYTDAEIQVLRIGAAELVAVPGEFFTELGQQIKGRLAQEGVAPVFILGFTNGNVGYIPARAAYPQGGYEVEYAHKYYGKPACVAPETGEQIVERAVALTRT